MSAAPARRAVPLISGGRCRTWAAAVLVCSPLLAGGATVAHAASSRQSVPHTTVTVQQAGPLSVFVGYAEDKEINTPDSAAFPTPWAGSPQTTFLGGTVPGQAACGTLTVCYDAGAIRLDNPGTAPVAVHSVSVDVHPGVTGDKVFNLWGSFTVPPGQSVILTENPPADNPGYDNFDTSGYPSTCTPITVAPTVTITIGSVGTRLTDSTHVLDTGGIDPGTCSPKHNESQQWRPIGAAGTSNATLRLGPATTRQVAGNHVAETATVLDGSGRIGLPHVTVHFHVISGPDAGTSGTAVTNSSGHATFTYTGTSEGEDVVTASVTTVGSFSTNSARVLWTDDSSAGWNSADIGGATPAGSQVLDPSTGTWTIQGGGAGVAGTADQFHYLWQTLAAGGGIGAQIMSETGTSASAQSGVMLRASTDPASPYYAAFVARGGGITVQDRAMQGGASATLTTRSGTPPAYLWVGHSGSTYTAYGSADGYDWVPIPGSTVTLASLTGAPLLAGLAVASDDSSTLATATVTSVVVSATPPAPQPLAACPAPWTCADIGSPTPAGTQSYDPNTGTWTITAGGADVTGTTDQFRYVWQTMTGDGSVSAQVATQTNTSSSAKAGIMLRASTSPAAPNYTVFVTPGTGIKVQVRKVQGGNTTKIANPAGIVPQYLKVTRSGNTFTAYTSPDGVTWTLIPGSTFTVSLPTSLLAGLAVTSHNTSTTSTVTMNNVIVG
jgi:hypothetical protein